MSTTSLPVHSKQTLKSATQFGNAVSWSEDDRIAVLGTEAITVFAPTRPKFGEVIGDNCGERSVIMLKESKKQRPAAVQEPLQHALRQLNDVTTVGHRAMSPKVVFRAFAWSPAGLSADGSCMLVTCATDHGVSIWHRDPSSYTFYWEEAVRLSDMLSSAETLAVSWSSLSAPAQSLIALGGKAEIIIIDWLDGNPNRDQIKFWCQGRRPHLEVPKVSWEL